MANEKLESLRHSRIDEHKKQGQLCKTQLRSYGNQMLPSATNALLQVQRMTGSLDCSDETGGWVSTQWSKGCI